MGSRYGRTGGTRRGVVPLLTASTALAALLWADWLIEGGTVFGVPYPVWATGALGGNVVLTLAGPRVKRALVAGLQKYLVNPPVRLLLRLGIPLGWSLLETRGRRTGRPRVVPVGNGLVGAQFWIIAEHGDQAAYVRNIRADPRVRVLLRRGLRVGWVGGTATVLDHDDPWARQRRIVGRWHPLRALNAMTVRVLGTRLLTVRIDLDPADARQAGGGRAGGERRACGRVSGAAG